MMKEESESIYSSLPSFGPALIVLAVSLFLLIVTHRFLKSRMHRLGRKRSFYRDITLIGITLVLLVVFVFSLPIGEGTKDQVLSLLGLAVTAVIALSSTTFVSNAMAGLMIRSVGSFRAGDFIRVCDQFGRVSERGLFHTEIQTEDRDLATLPNLLLVSNPVTVVRSSGTVVSSKVSLGYDTDRSEIEPLLKNAAICSGLDDPFVQVLELGDYSVTYRVAGFLKDIKQLVSARSALRMQTLDTLHRSGIEIMSPSVMMQRPISENTRLIPESRRSGKRQGEVQEGPEKFIFDKAELAEELERLQLEISEASENVSKLESMIHDSDTPAQRARLNEETSKLGKLKDRLEELERQ